MTFAKLPCGKSADPSEFIFFYISPLKSLNLVLSPGAKSGGHRGTWAGCLINYLESEEVKAATGGVL